MDEHPNPRNRADPEPILSTPLPEFSAAASATRSVTTNTASPFEPFRSASDPRNRARYSKKNTIFLYDWWLLLAPEVHEGRRLGVGGVVAERYRGSCRHEGDRSGSKFLLSPWQKAERVFESASITKRYDSFTLGTADGITVRIQGVINKACSHQNGLPLEVCKSFLIGFPYNWDNYAGACFEGKFNSASVLESAASPNELSEGFADAEGCHFPVHLDDFSMSRIRDGSVDGSVTSKFRDFLERFCYATKPLASDVHNCALPLVESCLPHEPPSKHVRATVLAQVTEGLEHVARYDKLSCSSLRDMAEGFLMREETLSIPDFIARDVDVVLRRGEQGQWCRRVSPEGGVLLATTATCTKDLDSSRGAWEGAGYERAGDGGGEDDAPMVWGSVAIADVVPAGVRETLSGMLLT